MRSVLVTSRKQSRSEVCGKTDTPQKLRWRLRVYRHLRDSPWWRSLSNHALSRPWLQRSVTFRLPSAPTSPRTMVYVYTSGDVTGLSIQTGNLQGRDSSQPQGREDKNLLRDSPSALSCSLIPRIGAFLRVNILYGVYEHFWMRLITWLYRNSILSILFNTELNETSWCRVFFYNLSCAFFASLCMKSSLASCRDAAVKR